MAYNPYDNHTRSKPNYSLELIFFLVLSLVSFGAFMTLLTTDNQAVVGDFWNSVDAQYHGRVLIYDDDDIHIVEQLPEDIEHMDIALAESVWYTSAAYDGIFRFERYFDGNIWRAYTLQDGDTAYSVADRFGLDVDYMLGSNTDYLSPSEVAPGDFLWIVAPQHYTPDDLHQDTASIRGRFDVVVNEVFAMTDTAILHFDGVRWRQQPILTNWPYTDLITLAAVRLTPDHYVLASVDAAGSVYLFTWVDGVVSEAVATLDDLTTRTNAPAGSGTPSLYTTDAEIVVVYDQGVLVYQAQSETWKLAPSDAIRRFSTENFLGTGGDYIAGYAADQHAIIYYNTQAPPSAEGQFGSLALDGVGGRPRYFMPDREASFWLFTDTSLYRLNGNSFEQVFTMKSANFSGAMAGTYGQVWATRTEPQIDLLHFVQNIWFSIGLYLLLSLGIVSLVSMAVVGFNTPFGSEPSVDVGAVLQRAVGVTVEVEQRAVGGIVWKLLRLWLVAWPIALGFGVLLILLITGTAESIPHDIENWMRDTFHDEPSDLALQLVSRLLLVTFLIVLLSPATLVSLFYADSFESRRERMQGTLMAVYGLYFAGMLEVILRYYTREWDKEGFSGSFIEMLLVLVLSLGGLVPLYFFRMLFLNNDFSMAGGITRKRQADRVIMMNLINAAAARQGVESGDYNLAEDALRKFDDDNLDRGVLGHNSSYLAAWAMYWLGRFDAAAALLLRAIPITAANKGRGRNLYPLLELYGMSLMRLGQSNAAERAFEGAIALSKRAVWAYLGLAELELLQNGSAARALEFLDESISRKTERGLFITQQRHLAAERDMLRAWAYSQQKSYGAADTIIDRVISQTTTRPPAFHAGLYWRAGMATLAQREPQAAAGYFKLGLQVDAEGAFATILQSSLSEVTNV